MIALTVFILAWAMPVPAGGEESPFDSGPPSLEVVSPHIPWAKPYPGKRLRALVIADHGSQRQCVELMQRLDIECVPFHCPGGAYSVDLGEAQGIKALRGRLSEPFDLVIGPGTLIGLFPPDLIDLLLSRLREGTGFVYLWPADAPHRLLSELGLAPKPPTDAGQAAANLLKGEREEAADEDTPLELEDRLPAWEREGLVYLAQGCPFPNLAGLQPAPAKEGEPPRPPITVHRCGKGRAVLIGRPGASQPGSPRLPAPEGPSDLLHEYFMALVVKAALWAAGHNPEIRLSHLQPSAGQEQDRALTFGLKNKTGPRRIDLTLAVRTDRDLHALPETPWAEPGVHRGATALQPIHTETKSLELATGDQSLALSLPPLPAGDYFVDVRLVAEGKNVDWVVIPWTVPAVVSIADIVFKPEAVNLAEGSALRARVDLDRPAPQDAVLDAALVDNHHRVLRRERIPIEEGALTVELAFDVPDAKSTLFKLRAAVQVGGQTLDVRTGYFTVYNRPWPSFTYFVWGGGSDSSYLGRQLHRVAAFHGVDAGFSGVSQAMLRVADLRSVGTVAGHHGQVEPGEMIVNPCCTSPAYRAGLRNGIREQAQLRRVSDCFGYTTGDETAYAGGLFAGCASETCTEHLHAFLQKQYRTIDALNRQWDTDYRSFEEIRAVEDPAAYNERAGKTGNFSARIDQWQANYDAYMDWFRYLDGALETYVPRARFGFMTNCFYGHERGYDFPRMMEICDFASPYCGWPPYFDCVQQFGSTDLIFGGHTVTRELDRFSRESWKIPFWVLLRGGRNAWYYLFTIGGEGAVTPYLDLYPCLAAYSEAVQAIKRGPADLLLGAKRKADPIGIYYSTPSLIFSSAISGPKHILHIRDSDRSLRDMGFEPQMLHTQQLLSGEIQNRGIRVLCLPMTECVSDQEVEVLRRFVEGGGLLIADYRPGIADEHGRLFAQKELPALFGLRWGAELLANGGGRLLTPLEAIDGTCTAALGQQMLPDLRIKGATDKALRTAGAHALAELAGVPLLTYQKAGQGAAVCLNIPVGPAVLGFLLAAHGVTSRVELQGVDDAVREVASVEVSSFSDGAAEYFGVACRYDTKPRKVLIRPSRRGHAYDLLQGAYLGEWERLEVDDFAQSVRIFSFLPYRVKGLELQCGRQAVPGGAMQGSVKVDTGGATPVRHVVHLDVQRPDGKSVRYLEQNLETKDGEAAFTVPLALNEPTGQWTLRARDVATGVGANATVTLEPGAEDTSPTSHRFQALQHKAVPNWNENPSTLADLVQEYPRASLHRRIDIVGRVREEKPDQASLDLLRQAVEDPDPVLCWSAVTALGALGPKAAPAATALGAALRSDRGIRRDILGTFRLIGAEAIREALPSIAECLEDANPRVRFEGLRTIAAAKHGTNEDVRRRIVECFRKHDLDKEDQDCNVLAAYLQALAVFATDAAALPIYTRAVEGFPMAIRLNEEERRTVQHGELVRTSARFSYYESELQRLHANNFTYRLMAAEALRKLGAKAETAIPAAIRALEAAAKEPQELDSGTRIQIWLNRQPNPGPPADENFLVAQALCQFLAGHGEKAKAALPVLKRLQELDPRLAETARNAMRKIDPFAEAGMELEREDAGQETP